MSDADFVLARYIHPNRGTHQVVGAAIHEERFDGFKMVRKRNRPPGWSVNYGNRAGGGVERFLVHKADIAAQPHYFLPVEERQAIAVPEVDKAPLGKPADLTGAFADKPRAEPEMPESHGIHEPEMVEPHEIGEPQPIDLGAIIDRKPEFSLQMLPGVGGALSAALETDGVRTREDVLELGLDGLTQYRGVGEFKAKMILKAASEA